jgi:hypothetical protein
MTPEELLRNEAANWFRQAGKDRNAAQLLLEAEPSRSAPYEPNAAEAPEALTIANKLSKEIHRRNEFG